MTSRAPALRPRILFVSLIEAEWGGSEVLWSEAALAARARGWEVAASFPYYKDLPQTRRLAAAGVALFYNTPPPTRWWRRLLKPALGPPERFQQTLERFAPTLVVMNQGGMRDGLAEMSECRRRQLPYVVLNQAIEPLFCIDPLWQDLRTAFAGALHIWCVSTENLAQLRTILSLPLLQAEAMPNAYGCPFDVACPWPAQDLPLRLAVVARLAPIQKGQDLLLDALAGPEWRARALTVTFFGAGETRLQLEARRAVLGLEQVNIPGQTARVANIWADHHALVLPSRFEGQSLAMIEAMLHARPVIATPVGGTAGVVIDEKTGFLASQVSTGALAEALERAWQRRAEWRELGQNASHHIRQIVSPTPGQDFVNRLAQALSVDSPTEANSFGPASSISRASQKN